MSNWDMYTSQVTTRLLGKGTSLKAIHIGKSVKLRYDKNSSQNAQNYLRENPAKVLSRKSAKSFLAKKSAKLHCCKSSERFGLKCEFSLVSNKYIPYIGLV